MDRRVAQLLDGLGLIGPSLLGGGDPSRVISSFVLYQLGTDRTLLRVRADSGNARFDLNSGTKPMLGSTAKLRTLITYLEIVSALHERLASMPATTLAGVAAAARDNVAGNTKEATEYCKTLYKDPRLDPLREVTTFDVAPSLSMQSNASYITEGQRPALDAFEGLYMQCRQKIATANPILWRIMVQVNPNPTEELKASTMVRLRGASTTRIGKKSWTSYRQPLREQINHNRGLGRDPANPAVGRMD